MGGIFDYPDIPMSIATGLIFAGIVAIGILFAHRFLQARAHDDSARNGIVEISLTVFSGVYGILLGLLVVGTYDNSNAVSDVVMKEADAISGLYLTSESFPEPAREEVLRNLRGYTRQVAEHSFTEQARGVRPENETRFIHDIARTLNSFVPNAKNEEALQNQAMREFDDLQEARHSRLNNFDIGIPGALWWIVGLGAAINLLLICLLEFPLKLHLAFGCLLAFFIGATIFVIASMDTPFSGRDRVAPGPIQRLLDVAETMPQ